MADVNAFPQFADGDRALHRHNISIPEYLALPINRRATLSQYWCRNLREFDGTDRSEQTLKEIIEVCRVVFTGHYYEVQRTEIIQQLKRLLEILRGNTDEEYFMYMDLDVFERLKDAIAEIIPLPLES